MESSLPAEVDILMAVSAVEGICPGETLASCQYLQKCQGDILSIFERRLYTTPSIFATRPMAKRSYASVKKPIPATKQART